MLTERWHPSALMLTDRWSPPMRKPRQSETRQCKPQQRKADDLSRCLIPFIADQTLIAVVELSLSGWLVAGVVPGVERQPLKKLKPELDRLLELLGRWGNEAERSGRKIARTVVAYEAGRDGFWLARSLKAYGIEAHVIHPASVAVSREHRRAKTDRLDTELLKRAFIGWLRGERDHCRMVAIPTFHEEDAKRPSRERECLVAEQSRLINRMKSTLVPLRHPRLQPEAEVRNAASGGVAHAGTLAIDADVGRAIRSEVVIVLRVSPDALIPKSVNWWVVLG